MSEDRREHASAVEDLAVFRRAYAVSLEVHRVSLDFPKVEQWALADQVRRASKSICANLGKVLVGRAGRPPTSSGLS